MSSAEAGSHFSARSGGDANLDTARLPPSLWADTSPAGPVTAPLAAGAHVADLVIVGAGFTGLTAALRAVERGARVIVLEAAEVGWGASGRNNGQVIPAMTRADPDVLVDVFGAQKGEALVRLIGGSAQTLFDLVRAHGIDCDATQSGWIQPAHRASRMTLIRSRYAQWQRRGFDVELLDRDETSARVGSRFWHGAWQTGSGGHLNPLSFVRGLATAAQRAGVAIHGRSPVVGLERSGDGWRVRTSDAYVETKRVILATHSYSDEFSASLWPGMARTLLPMRSYQLATRPLPAALRATILPQGHALSDTHGDLHVARFARDGRLITAGSLIVPFGFEHRLRERLSARLQRMFPQLLGHALHFDYVWHGKFAVTPDGLPRFKRLAEGVYAWVGCNGRGVALSTAVGPMLADAALADDPAHCALPIESIRTIAAHSIVSRTAMAGLLLYRWRDSRD